MDPYARLAEAGLHLPPVSAPRGAYLPAVRVGNLVYVSGQVPIVDGIVVSSGPVGAETSLDMAKELSKACALSALSAVDDLIGLANVIQVARLVGYVASASGFYEQAKVVDGASDLLLTVLGEKGRHARTSIGVSTLPFNVSVEIEVTLFTHS
jgi:enamine deaminase RidA (YjgF/YER057c/UK114 family)